MIQGVELVGMKEFIAKVRAAEPNLATQLRLGLKRVATLVSDTAKPSVPRRSGRLAQSVRPQATAKTAAVSMGSNAVPYAGFIEFGGRVGRNKSVVRPLVKEGRYLRPAYERRAGDVAVETEQILERVVEGID